MHTPRIAIIMSTTRAARFGHKPAEWLRAMATDRKDLSFEILDLRNYPMPFPFDELASNLYAPSTNPIAKKWQSKVAEFDGYIFVTGEYNNSVPAVLKNALDTPIPNGIESQRHFSAMGRSAAPGPLSTCAEIRVGRRCAFASRSLCPGCRLHERSSRRQGYQRALPP